MLLLSKMLLRYRAASAEDAGQKVNSLGSGTLLGHSLLALTRPLLSAVILTTPGRSLATLGLLHGARLLTGPFASGLGVTTSTASLAGAGLLSGHGRGRVLGPGATSPIESEGSGGEDESKDSSESHFVLLLFD